MCLSLENAGFWVMVTRCLWTLPNHLWVRDVHWNLRRSREVGAKGAKNAVTCRESAKSQDLFARDMCAWSREKNTGAPAIDILREAFFSVILSTISAMICWLAYINPKNQEFQSLSAPYYIHSPWSELGPQNTASSNTHASEMQYWHPNKHRGKKHVPKNSRKVDQKTCSTSETHMAEVLSRVIPIMQI